jgi:hypothetical protein
MSIHISVMKIAMSLTILSLHKIILYTIVTKSILSNWPGRSRIVVEKVTVPTICE